MMRLSRMVLTLVAASACLYAAFGFAAHALKPDGTVAVQVESWVPRGQGFGYTWANGMLRTTNGVMQVFTLQGLGIRGNEGGIADMKARGQVFNLKNAADFEGTYQRLSGDSPVGTDPKALIMKNEKGVVVILEVKVETETNPDLSLDDSDHDVKVRIEH